MTVFSWCGRVYVTSNLLGVIDLLWRLGLGFSWYYTDIPTGIVRHYILVFRYESGTLNTMYF